MGDVVECRQGEEEEEEEEEEREREREEEDDGGCALEVSLYKI